MKTPKTNCDGCGTSLDGIEHETTNEGLTLCHPCLKSVGACPRCGAIKPSRPVLAWDQIPGLLYLKRAIEVSLSGELTLGVIHTPSFYIEALLSGTAPDKFSVYTAHPCKCGWFGSPARECRCTLENIEAHRNSERVATVFACDVIVKAEGPTPREISDSINRRYGETLDVIAQRGREARTRPLPSDTLDEAGRHLASAWMKQADPNRWPYVLRVARAIARLAGHESIQVADLAEAMQYQMTPERIW